MSHPEKWMTRAERRELKILKHAGAMATDADTYVALARGRTVHASRLKPEHVRALKRR